MKLSEMAKGIQPSFTRQLFDRAKQYDNVIDFTLGDPDYPTPDYVRKAGCKAIENGNTKYSANAGLAQLREVITDSIFKESGVKYNALEEIVVTVGAMEALYLSLCSMIDRGDEVIIPAPYWINYQHMVQMCGGVPVIVNSSEENDFVVLFDDIKAAITKKTTAIILNSPNNPTGTIYDKESLRQICSLAEENDFAVIFDECYKTITYDGERCPSVLDIENVKDNVVIINSCSKKYSMTGWRLGYAAVPKELAANMTKLQENIVACASLPSQYAAIAAFGGDDKATEKMREGFEKRRNVFVDGINKIPKLHCKKPKGTFYALVNIKETGLNSVDFAYKLLDEQHVAVVPGITYGDCCEGYVRIAYTMDEEKITEGISRIEKFIKNL